VNLLDALRDRSLLGALPAFADLRSWAQWFTYEKARRGVPLDGRELEDFRRFTGRTAPQAGGYRAGLVLTGRQAGKTRWLATSAAFEAVSATAAPGAFVTFVGQDLRGAQRAAWAYVREVFDLPAFRGEVLRQTQDTIELRSGVTLAVPPLRERKDDLVPLAKFFLGRVRSRGKACATWPCSWTRRRTSSRARAERST